MKKIVIVLFMTVFFLILSGCGNQNTISGRIVETNIKENSIVSFILKTDENKKIGIFLTDETTILSFFKGLTAEEFKSGFFNDIIISVECDNSHRNLTTRDNQEITTYNAKNIEIKANLTRKTTLLDGTVINIWNYLFKDIYALDDGTELLINDHMSEPNIENFENLNSKAKFNILKFYENQGLLYDVQTQLEKAYSDYLKEEPSKFDYYIFRQDISLTASNEAILCFLTSAVIPLGNNNNAHEIRIGATFDRKTGNVINNWDLFSCSIEEAKQKILDIADVNDSILRKEMEIALKQENIILFENNMEICFEKGTLPSQEHTYILGLEYGNDLINILNEWVVSQNDN